MTFRRLILVSTIPVGVVVGALVVALVATGTVAGPLGITALVLSSIGVVGGIGLAAVVAVRAVQRVGAWQRTVSRDVASTREELSALRASVDRIGGDQQRLMRSVDTRLLSVLDEVAAVRRDLGAASASDTIPDLNGPLTGEARRVATTDPSRRGGRDAEAR